MKLHELAHARAGDKGDTSQISIILYDVRDYVFLARHLTVERVQRHLEATARGAVTRYELPRLGILNFVLEQALATGVTRSLALDAHGKCLSSVLLDIELPERD